jgi:MYXO-CTERM domain-containing protein
LILAGIAQVPPEAHADITYNFVDHPTLENGYTLAGTITVAVDGLGNVTSIDAWTVEILKQATPQITFSSTTPGANTNFGGLEATANTLTLESNGVLQLNVSNSVGNNGLNDITAIGKYLETIPFGSNPSIFWNTAIPNSPFIVATAPAAAPEPSTVIVAVFGAVAFAAYGWSRRRRDQRRQAAA